MAVQRIKADRRQQQTGGPVTAARTPVVAGSAKISSRIRHTPYSRPTAKLNFTPHHKTNNENYTGQDSKPEKAFVPATTSTTTASTNSGSGIFGFLGKIATNAISSSNLFFGLAGNGSRFNNDPFQVPWKTEENEARELRRELIREKAKAKRAQARIDATLRRMDETSQSEKEEEEEDEKYLPPAKGLGSSVNDNEKEEANPETPTPKGPSIEDTVSTPEADSADSTKPDDNEKEITGTPKSVKSKGTPSSSPSVFEIAMKSRAKFGQSPKSAIKLTPKTPTSVPNSSGSNSTVRQHRWFWESKAVEESTSSPTLQRANSLQKKKENKEKENSEAETPRMDISSDDDDDDVQKDHDTKEASPVEDNLQKRPPLPQQSSSASLKLPHFPSTFVDIVSKVPLTQGGKKRRIPQESTDGNTKTKPAETSAALVSSSAPSPAAKRFLSHAMFTPSQPLRVSSSTSTGGITRNKSAATLMQAALRRRKRRASTAYYGTGYTSKSAPYRSSLSSSTFLRPSHSENSTPALAQGESFGQDGSPNESSSITARKILDIINELPPITNQASASSSLVGRQISPKSTPSSIVNPYELKSPYSVKLRSKPAQQKQQQPQNKRTSMVFNDDDNSNSVLSVLERTAPKELKKKKQVKDGSSIKKSEITPAHVLLFAKKQQKEDKTSNPEAVGEKEKAAVVSASAVVSNDLPPWAQPKPKEQQQPVPKEKPVKANISEPAPVPTFTTASELQSEPKISSTNQTSLFGNNAANELTTAASASSEITVPLRSATSESFFNKPLVNVETVSASKLVSDMPIDKLPIFRFSNISKSKPSSGSIIAMDVDTEDLPAYTFGGSTKSQQDENTVKESSGSLSNDDNPFAKLSAMKPGEWRCSLCSIINAPTEIKECPICKEPKPGAAEDNTTDAKPLASSFGGNSTTDDDNPFAKLSAMKAGDWRCSLCSVVNAATETKECPVCKEPKPGAAKEDSADAGAKPPVPSFGGFKPPTSSKNSSSDDNPFAKLSAMKPGDWKCSLCSIVNPSTATKECPACKEPKPGVAKDDNNSSVDQAKPIFGGFKPSVSFQSSSSSASQAFSFGNTNSSNDGFKPSSSFTGSTTFGSNGSGGGGFKPTF